MLNVERLPSVRQARVDQEALYGVVTIDLKPKNELENDFFGEGCGP